MDITEIIERLKNIAGHAVHTVGERPFVMSLDDGIAVHEAIELLEKTETNRPETPDSWIPVSERLPEKNNVDGWIAARPDVEAITVEWITKYMRSLKSGTFADPAWIIKTMLEEWREEQEHDLMD